MFKYIVLSSLLLLAACNVGENYTHSYFFSDKDLQKNLDIQPSEKIIANNWYEIFNDSDLNTLIQYSMNSNFTLKIQKRYQY